MPEAAGAALTDADSELDELLAEVIEGDTLAVLAWQSERGECETRVVARDLPVEARPDGDG
ncbi:MAG: hypothetical protein QOF38_3773, partial [Pseudonocardiales bacterium]|nr:hypothetical protein [Pseudonocardiales bacterium]